LAAAVEEYLSLQHRDNRRDGCPIAAMGSELTRSGTKTREAVTAGFQKLVETPGSADTEATIVGYSKGVAT
jgi:TetR/AcrR family transcriptional repressor of nem operon